MSRRRVVISGLGPVTAFGVGLDALWEPMVQGRTAVRRIRRFDPQGFPCAAAAELDDDRFNFRDYVPKSYRKATKVMCRDIQLAVAGAAAAVRDAGLVTRGTDPDAKPTIPPSRLGCHIGAGLIAADIDELNGALWTSRTEAGTFDIGHWGRAGMNNLTPLWLLKYLPNMLACHVTIIHDCEGPSNTITCCEASSALSISESVRVIERGAADACLSGGAESKVNLMGLLRQHYAGRLAPTPDGEDPAGAVRPFDAAARGCVIGEGGGIVVVEAEESAQQRGARAYAQVLGFASTQSYCPDTVGLEIEEDGQAISDAMQIALDRSSTSAREIDAIVPFGSGIANVDRAEAAAIKRVFGPRSAEVPLITVIPNTGNCNAGAGTVAMAVAANAIRTQTLPARINTTSSDGLNAAASPSRGAALRRVLVTSTSQGGQNCAIVLGRVDS